MCVVTTRIRASVVAEIGIRGRDDGDLMNAPGIFKDIFETPAEVMFGFEKNGEDVRL